MKTTIETGKSFFSRPCLLGVALAAALLLFAGGCRQEKVEKKVEVLRPVKLMTIKDSQAALTQGFPGTVRAARRAVLSFKVSGPLVQLPVEEGREVEKGALIAQIDKRDFQTAVNAAMARFKEAEQQFRRYKELYAKNQVSKAEFDRYQAARDMAKAKLEDAANALCDTTLRAPFAGVIAKRYVENYYKVQAKEPIVDLQDISRIEVLVDIPELVMAAMRRQDAYQVKAAFEALPGKQFPLKLKEFSTEADPNTQTYQVVLVMDQPPGANIYPGMTAMVTATLQADKQAADIYIPAMAVLDAPGNKPYVWLFDPKAGVVHRREVKVSSLEGTDSIHILEGLKPGEQIVIAGVTKLKEGMKVRPWEKQREGK
ncbi:MAG: efflux RND transporter periplasmic adaptor subunit [Deltaproteobacteria bacterium]|nr:efflux RND transporter periplasmic adaptor subunit [Deltaproteobacteria bacterium]